MAGVLTPCPLTLYNTLSSTTNPMPGFSPCSDLATRQLKWISRGDQLKNGSRPAQYVAWGISAVSIAAQYAETYSSEAKGRTVDWG